MDSAVVKAQILIEALPYIRSFFGKSIVVKYGGAAMVEEKLKAEVAQDIVLMRYVGMRPVIVHGGGPQIGEAMTKAGLTPTFIDGLRVTDSETMHIVEAVMVGNINQEIVGLINRSGGTAVGLSGKDGNFITAKKATHRRGRGAEAEMVDLGLVGEVVTVNPRVVQSLEEAGFIPVIAPTGVDEEGVTYNINADLAAGEIAAALAAEKLILLTDIDGILDREGQLYSTLGRDEVEKLVEEQVISTGMVPKVKACLRALEGGVRKTHIINGTIPHALLLELLTAEGVGTEVTA
ncbi:MAG: acetylglutamate kinase [candidate division NC10 bacterium]|jgi:acetylglutamate kinase|nr:acetylglutamate kinase [candidate division NC10 bacterium]MCH7895891.1 acetylglutamate kinase [candidate division NC10 bacterium]MCZ6551342.1 acetylglutamate kinase [candidate division NC10 bacterium]